MKEVNRYISFNKLVIRVTLAGFEINSGPVARVYQKCRRTTKPLMCSSPVGHWKSLDVEISLDLTSELWGQLALLPEAKLCGESALDKHVRNYS